MKDFRVPGVIWIVATIIIVALIHGNALWIESTLHVEPWLIDMVIALVVGALKAANLGTDQLNQALDVIDLLLKPKPVAGPVNGGTALPRGAQPPVPETALYVDDIPKRPSNFARWLVG